MAMINRYATKKKINDIKDYNVVYRTKDGKVHKVETFSIELDEIVLMSNETKDIDDECGRY